MSFILFEKIFILAEKFNDRHKLLDDIKIKKKMFSFSKGA